MALKGHIPWNKGMQSPLTKCPRHRVMRVRKGSVYCPVCKNEASKAWNLRNPEKIKRYKERHKTRS